MFLIARVATICEWCVRRRKNSTRDVKVICHSCIAIAYQLLASPSPQRKKTSLVSPEIEMLDELDDLAERQNEERIVQRRRRDSPNDLEDVLLRPNPSVHGEQRVPRRWRVLLPRLEVRPLQLLILHAHVERLHDPLAGHERLGRRFVHFGRVGLSGGGGVDFARGEDAQLVTVGTGVDVRGVELFELALALFFEEKLIEIRRVREGRRTARKNRYAQARRSSPTDE